MVPENRSLADYCATRHPGLDLHCFVPDPPTTKGEGRELRRLAAQYGWRTVIVVTFRPHISRARFILEQCFDGDLVMVGESDTRLCSQVGVCIRLRERCARRCSPVVEQTTPPRSLPSVRGAGRADDAPGSRAGLGVSAVVQRHPARSRRTRRKRRLVDAPHRRHGPPRTRTIRFAYLSGAGPPPCASSSAARCTSPPQLAPSMQIGSARDSSSSMGSQPSSPRNPSAAIAGINRQVTIGHDARSTLTAVCTQTSGSMCDARWPRSLRPRGTYRRRRVLRMCGTRSIDPRRAPLPGREFIAKPPKRRAISCTRKYLVWRRARIRECHRVTVAGCRRTGAMENLGRVDECGTQAWPGDAKPPFCRGYTVHRDIRNETGRVVQRACRHGAPRRIDVFERSTAIIHVAEIDNQFQHAAVLDIHVPLPSVTGDAVGPFQLHAQRRDKAPAGQYSFPPNLDSHLSQTPLEQHRLGSQVVRRLSCRAVWPTC